MDRIEIFLVEDSSDFRKLVRTIFNKFLPDYNVRFFRGAEELYRYMILQSSEDFVGRRPVLIILDLKLTNFEGSDVLRLIRKTPSNALTDWKTIPVVMLSGIDSQDDINKCYQAGASSYLVKPVDFDQLRILLQTLCHYWIDLNRLAGHKVAQPNVAQAGVAQPIQLSKAEERL